MAYAMTPQDQNQAFNDWADGVPGPHGAAMRAFETQPTVSIPTDLLRHGLAALYAPPPVQPPVAVPSAEDMRAYTDGLRETQLAMQNYWRTPAPPATQQASAPDVVATAGADFLGGIADGLTGTGPQVSMGNLRQAWGAANPGGLTPAAGQPDPRQKPTLA